MLNKLERKFGRIKWPSFMLILLGAYATGVLMSKLYYEALEWVYFSPSDIFRGQVWRVFTFVATPSGNGILMTVLMCFIYFSISRSLERIIGRFKVNFFLLTGWFLTLLAGFIYHFVFPQYSGITQLLNIHNIFWTSFILFPLLYPDATFLLMFFIPIKGKWMPLITLGYMVYDVVAAFLNPKYSLPYGWLTVFMIVAALINVVVFLLLLGYNFKSLFKPRENNARNSYGTGYSQSQSNASFRGTAERRTESRNPGAPGYAGYVHPGNSGARTIRPYRHKCCVCGRTDQSDPELEFRYCSKCIGPFEYCSDHIYTHVHKTPSGGGNS